MVECYAQKEGIDFSGIFSPVVRLTTIGKVVAMCAELDLHLVQLNVKTASIHGDLEEEVCSNRSFSKQKELGLQRLNKSLYDLKQVPWWRYKRFDSFISLGYNKHSSDHCMSYKRFGDIVFIILLLYVDDLLVTGPNKVQIQEFKGIVG